MALSFSNTADRVAVTGNAGINDLATFSVVVWVYLNSLPGTVRRVWSIGTAAQKRIAIDSAGTLELAIAHATDDTYATSADNAVTTGSWLYLACTWSGTGNLPKLYKGTLSTLVSELTPPQFSGLGTGSPASESSGNMNWGNKVGVNAAIDGRLAIGMHFNKVLSLGELQMLQFHPRLLDDGSCKDFKIFGYNGTGTQPDLSGNGNSGTCSGAGIAVGAHVPMRALFGIAPGWLGAFTAAAVAAVPRRRMLLGVGI